MRLPTFKNIKKLRKNEAVIVEKTINGDNYKAMIFVTDYIKEAEFFNEKGNRRFIEYLSTEYDYVGDVYKNGILIKDNMSFDTIYDELILDAENNSDSVWDSKIN